MTFLAETFEKLANDPSWPEQLMTLADQIDGRIIIELKTLGQLKLEKARLALMVVEERAHRTQRYAILEQIDNSERELEPWEIAIKDALAQKNVNPDDYAIVKKRVEEADTAHPIGIP